MVGFSIKVNRSERRRKSRVRGWEKRVTDAGGNLIGGQGLIVNEAPDDAALDECRALGESAVA